MGLGGYSFQEEKTYHIDRNDMPTSNQHQESAFQELWRLQTNYQISSKYLNITYTTNQDDENLEQSEVSTCGLKQKRKENKREKHTYRNKWIKQQFPEIKQHE